MDVERMQTGSAFDAFVGRIVKIVYNDDGEIKVKKGRLISDDGEFLQLRTYEHTYIINRTAITELKLLEREK